MIRVKHKKVLATAILIFVLSGFVSVQPASCEVVSTEWRNMIEAYLQQVDANTTAEIVVYVVQSLTGHGIKDDGIEINEIVKLGVYIFNRLSLDTPNGPVVGIGKTQEDNGVLLLVSMEEREWRIEVGYGLEGYITDIESNLIAQQYLVPKFRDAKYGEGLYDTVVALSKKIPGPAHAGLPIRGRYLYENLVAPTEIPTWAIVLVGAVFSIVVIVIIVIAYLVKKGRIKMEKTRSSHGGFSGGGGSRPSGGSKDGGGRSGGGGASGKW